MASWTSSNPCKNCGRKSGSMVKCTNCGTLGCAICIGQVSKSLCKVCKKTTIKVRVQRQETRTRERQGQGRGENRPLGLPFLIKPFIRFSRTRLSDVIHSKAHALSPTPLQSALYRGHTQLYCLVVGSLLCSSASAETAKTACWLLSLSKYSALLR